MSFNINISDFLKKTSELQIKMIQGTRLYAETSAKKLESYAKENAPWDDVTNISRQTISSSVTSSGNSQRITLIGGTTAHFKYLELAHEKKYAIIRPTMLKLAPGIVKGWHKVIK